jgi:alkylation response protein AidB-like acyl-CoA dehydrogenase
MAHAYDAPLALMRVALEQAAQQLELRSIDSCALVLDELAAPVLESAARFAGSVLSPLNPVGDQNPARLEAGAVRTPPGFASAYRRFCADGWPALAAPTEFGGQALPILIAAATTEMWAGANLAFAMCPESAVGAAEALRRHAAPELAAHYLPPLVSGTWTAAMCLTEPQAGSDLSTLRTLARPDADAWRVSGRKIYISWGDHDLADNIVHLVLARTPDAPAGTRGISLFLVPKRLGAGDAASPPNDIVATSLEHKMGIRASPTCAMSLGERGGARGWLIGRQHEGLACMFTMMNQMRLGVALHSTGVAERALQLARVYAHERRQGRGADGAQRPIIEHADVRRMLLTMKTLTHAARCLAYTAAAALDAEQRAPSAALRAGASRRLGLLTPLAKAWCSDVAVEVASLGVQVHGGMGYIDDCEASQIYRDARIGPIFEGTNYIQAQDLLLRKVLRDEGPALEELLGAIEQAAQGLGGSAAARELTPLRDRLLGECARLRAATDALRRRLPAEPELAGCVAYAYLQWLGVVAGGWQWALSAQLAFEPGRFASERRALLDGARFYAAHILPRSRVAEAIVEGGADSVLAPQLSEL